VHVAQVRQAGASERGQRSVKGGCVNADLRRVLTWLTRRPLPFIVAAMMLAITGVMAWAGFSRDHDRAARQQDEAANQAVESVRTLVGGLEYRVGSLRGLFAASESVTDHEFHIFTAPLLHDHGASGLGWVDMVPDAERRAWEHAHDTRISRLEGLRLVPAERSAGYAVLTHLVPAPVRVGIGLDANTFDGQAGAMRQAVRTGRTEATPPVVMPGSGEPSLVLYAPAFRDGAVLDDARDRRAALIGFGIGIFGFADLRSALERSLTSGTDVTITTDGQPVLSVGDLGDAAAVRQVDIAGQPWTVSVTAPERGGIGLGWLTVIVGALVTVLLTLFTAQSARSEAAARELARARERERDAVESAQQTLLDNVDELFVIHYDGDLRVVRASGALLKSKRFPPDEVVGRTAYELERPGRDDQVVPALEAALRGEHTSFDLVDPDTGRILWMQALPLAGSGAGAMLVGLDVSARAEAEERFRRSFEDAPVGMALLDGDGRFLEANDALGAILGTDADTLVGRLLGVQTHPEDADDEREQLADLLAGRAVRCSYEKRAIHADGHALWVAVHATELGAAAGVQRMFLAQILDISDQRRFAEQLQHLADHDPLTGLENRRAFERAVDAHLADVKRYGDEGALLVLDLDHFKAVNDTLGHHAGDALIVAVGDILRGHVRDSDRVARLGGDEFAVLLPKADEEQARIVAAKLVAAVRDERRVLGGRAWTTTVSVGVALFSAAVERGEQVMVDADLAMYDAKEAGRDRYGVYRAGERATSRTRERLAWMDRIRGALEEDRFTLLAQPILDLGADRVVHHELLLRMVAPDGDLIPPGSFLSIAERFGLVIEIDDWVVRRAIQTLADHADRGLVLEVNLSGSSIGSPELLSTIERELTRTGVDPRALIFEVTETAAVSNIPRARAFADRLGALGCSFALDDFGAGFGSFYYLKHLPFDFLKIDGEFVRHCVASSVDRVIISSLVGVANGLGKRTIAEYVDDQSTIEMLRELGVDLAQGYSIGRPEQLEHWLAVDRAEIETA
jgi:diguanylate cyclase (GGDEF)-like protein/PAS domain S-box-containing protein